MAQLVSVYRSDDQIIERRQLPLAIDDKLKVGIFDTYDSLVKHTPKLSINDRV